MASKKNKVKTKTQTKPVVEVVKAETIDEKINSAVELVQKIAKSLQDDKATGFLFAVAGQDGKILPYASAGSIGDLLTLKYVIDKEITRLIDNQKSGQ